MNWQDRITVKKGTLGEEIVDRYLRERGYIPYRPDADGAHPFDRLVASRDKKTVFVADVKSKAQRTHYPDTGIDVRHYGDYSHIARKYGLPVFLVFVDEIAGEIYGNFLKELDKPRDIRVRGRMIHYPWNHKGQRYWPISAMRPIGRLSGEEISRLTALSTRNPAYNEGLA